MVVGDLAHEIDVLVIGAGPGGYVAAIRAAQLGKSVVIADRSEVGGVCLNRGCIPSKALISAAHRYETMKHSDHMGLSVEGVNVDFSKVQAWKEGVVKNLTGGVSGLLKGNKIQVVHGEAFFINEKEVRIFSEEEGARYQFNHCIIATGSRPIELKAFPYSGRIISSTEALSLQEVPASMVVIGGGYIGVELGQTYAKFGSKVTILEGSDSILPLFEKDITRLVGRQLKKDGVVVETGALAQGVVQNGDSVTVTYTVKGEEKSITADYVLVTVGRRPNLEELQLDAAGIKLTERGNIAIDHQCKTNLPNIYAIGDIVEGPALAHKASYEGKVAAEVIAGHNSAVNYQAIPAVVFSDPEIATVGLAEKEAKDRGYEVVTGRFNYGANGRALSLDVKEGFVRIVAEKETGLVLGAQIIGPEASNIITEVGLAIEMGTTLEDIALTIHAHPTLGELVLEAAEVALGQPIHAIVK